MATMSKEYWEKRQHERESKAYSSILEVEKEYKEALERAKINIDKQISHIGTQYMKDNQLSYAEAMKQLKGSEYKVWRKQLDEYMQEWKQLKRTAPMEAKKLWLEIETLSARSRISRLDSIRTQIDIELSKVSTEAVESTRKALYGVYGDTYKEVVKDLGIKSMFSDSMVKAVIARPWSGANYSNRIWGNSEKLARVLKQEVTTGMIQGINLKTMGKRISDRIEGAKKNDVERLLRTEVNYTMNQATLDGYKDAKVEKYEFDATLDSRTSQICAELNGEVFEVNKTAVGVNYPPMHPRCRSTTSPIIDYEVLGKRLREEKDLKENEESSKIEKRVYIPLTEKELEYRDPYQSFLKEKEYIDWKNSVTIDEKNAIEIYTGSRYELFNGFLRGDIKNVDENTLTEIENLKSALSKYEVKETFTAYRGTYARFGIEKQNIGDVFVLDKGFSSSTVARNITDDFSEGNGSAVYRIRIPKGKKVGAYVDEFSTFKGEEEFLFLPETKFRLLKVETKEITDGVQYIYDLEVV